MQGGEGLKTLQGVQKKQKLRHGNGPGRRGQFYIGSYRKSKVLGEVKGWEQNFTKSAEEDEM